MTIKPPPPRKKETLTGDAKWEPWRAAYVEGRLRTLEDVSQASGISISTVSKHSMKNKWNEQRTALEAAARAERDKVMVKTRLQRLAELDQQTERIADFLLGKAILTLDKKHEVNGTLQQVPFSSEAHALNALGQALRLKRQVATGLQQEEEQNLDKDPAIPEDERALRQMTGPQLAKLYLQLQAKTVDAKPADRPKGDEGQG